MILPSVTQIIHKGRHLSRVGPKSAIFYDAGNKKGSKRVRVWEGLYRQFLVASLMESRDLVQLVFGREQKLLLLLLFCVSTAPAPIP